MLAAPIFVDSAQYIAFLSPNDNLHEAANETAELLNGQPTVTSEAVLVEVLNMLASRGPNFRRQAVEFVETLRDELSVTIEPQTPELFDKGMELFRDRPDKTYGLTDCMSMVTCKKYNVAEVATSDHDFVQEGYTILLPRVP